MPDRFIHVERRQSRRLKRGMSPQRFARLVTRPPRQPWALFEAVVVCVVTAFTFTAITAVLVRL